MPREGEAMECRLEDFANSVSRIVGETNTAIVGGEFRGRYGFSETPVVFDSWPLQLLVLRRGVRLRRFALVRPSSGEEVEEVVREAVRHGVKIVVRGGGSAVVGAILPCRCCAVLETSRLRQVELYEDDMVVYAGAGVRIAELEEKLNRRGYTLRFEPQSREIATIGGAIATRGAGAYQPGIGNIEDSVLWIDAVTPARGLARFGDYGPRGSLTVDSKKILIGSEGSIAVIVGAGLRILPAPTNTATVVAAMPSFREGLEAARKLTLQSQPELLRLIDEVEAATTLGVDKPLLMARVEGFDGEVVEARRKHVEKIVLSHGGRIVDEDLYTKWVKHRMRFRENWDMVTSAGLWLDTVDIAAVWSKAMSLRERVLGRLQHVKGFVAGMAHAGHFYPTGVAIYFTLVFEPDPATYWRIWRAVVEVARGEGVQVTHHHSLGALRTALGAWSSDLELLCGVKKLLDPYNTLWSPLARICMVRGW